MFHLTMNTNPMTEKIEQIRAGELAIQNDLNNPELMAKVLRYVSDSDKKMPSLGENFYFFSSISNRWVGFNEVFINEVLASEILAWMEKDNEQKSGKVSLSELSIADLRAILESSEMISRKTYEAVQVELYNRLNRIDV